MSCKILQLLVIIHIAFLPTLFSQTNEQLRANLYAFSADGTSDLYDGNLTMYNINNSNAVNNMDAVKMSNFGENFGLLRGTTTLVIERRASIITADTTFFKMWNMRKATYKLEMWLTGLDHPGMTGILEDAYLDTKTTLDLNAGNNYTFTITAVPASYASDRFRIIFSSLAKIFSPLPVTFSGIKVYQKNNKANVEWTVENQKNIVRYEIAKSLDGRQFYTSSTVIVKQKNTSIYQWTDLSPSENGYNFYRISSTDLSGHIEYSKVMKVFIGIENQSISVYPNPVAGGLINLHLTAQPKGIYTARVINDYGQLLHQVQLQHDGGSNIQTIQLNKNMGRGSYYLEIITPRNQKINTKIFLQ